MQCAFPGPEKGGTNGRDWWPNLLIEIIEIRFSKGHFDTVHFYCSSAATNRIVDGQYQFSKQLSKEGIIAKTLARKP